MRVSRGMRLRRIAMNRAGIQTGGPQEFFEVAVGAREIPTFPPRYKFAGPVAGVLTAGLTLWLTGLPRQYVVIGVLVGVIVHFLEAHWAEKRILHIEAQLADAIDHMVATLRAGSALQSALELVHRETQPPIRDEFEQVLGRIRVGEDPRAAVRDLAFRVPLESFRLFAHCLLVHWETGGSLVTSLRTVGRTIRDRLELSQRINAQAVESQISVIAVMGISYGLTLLMLKTNPGPIQKLLYSPVGASVACLLILMQTAGITFIWRMSRIRF